MENCRQIWYLVFQLTEIDVMKFDAIVHEAEEGGYWAEVPAVPGCRLPFRMIVGRKA